MLPLFGSPWRGSGPPGRLPQPSLGRRGRAGGGAARGRGLALGSGARPGAGWAGGPGAGPGRGHPTLLARGLCCLQFGAAGGRGRVWVSVRRSLGASLPGDAAALADISCQPLSPGAAPPTGTTHPLPGPSHACPGRSPPPPAPRSPTCILCCLVSPQVPLTLSHPPSPGPGPCHPSQPYFPLGYINHLHPPYSLHH